MSGHKPLIAAFSVAVVAFYFLPGQEGAYRLSKWGMGGFALLFFSGAFLFSLIKTPLAVAPREKLLFGSASAYVVSAILLPAWITPFATTHMAGTLALLMGLSFCYLTSLAFQESPLCKRRGIVTVVLAGGAAAMIVILQAMGLPLFDIPIPNALEFRSPGTLGNPNWAASFLLPLVPLSLSLRSSSCSRRENLLYRAITLLLVVATFATLSKAGALALLGGLIVYGLLDQELKPSLRLLALLALGLMAAVSLLAVCRSDYLSSLPWMRGRLFLWQGALALSSAHPIAGIGLGGYLPSYLETAAGLIHGDSRIFMPLGRIDFVHNDPLQMAAEGGLVTGLLYLALIVSMVRTAYQRNDAISRGVGAAVAAIFLYGLADSALQLPATFFLFWFLAGWLMSGPADDAFPAREGGRQPGFSRAFSAAALLLIGTLGLVQGIRFTLGNYFWTRGNALVREQRVAGITALRIAAECLPEIGKIRSAYAKSLAAAGRYPEAVAELDAAATVYSDFDDRFLRLRLLEKITGRDYGYAWQQLAGKFPALVTPHFELGVLYLKKGNREAATQEFVKVLENRQDSRAAGSYREKAGRMLVKIHAGSEMAGH